MKFINNTTLASCTLAVLLAGLIMSYGSSIKFVDQMRKGYDR